MIIYFAVERDDVAPARRRHGLTTGGRQVNDRQTAMAQVCGMHPQARMGQGLSAFDAHDVLMDISALGCDAQKISENPPMCFEKAEDDNDRAWQEQLMERNG